jgi:hypothetical protein
MAGSQWQIDDICIITQDDISINCGFPQERAVPILAPDGRLLRAPATRFHAGNAEKAPGRVKRRRPSENRLFSLS